MSLKQTVENHPVVFYLGSIVASFALGLASYEGITRITGRTIISPVDAEKLKNYESVTAKLDAANLETQAQRKSLAERDSELATLRRSVATSDTDIANLRRQASERDVLLVREQERVRVLTVQGPEKRTAEPKPKNDSSKVLVQLTGVTVRPGAHVRQLIR